MQSHRADYIVEGAECLLESLRVGTRAQYFARHHPVNILHRFTYLFRQSRHAQSTPTTTPAAAYSIPKGKPNYCTAEGLAESIAQSTPNDMPAAPLMTRLFYP